MSEKTDIRDALFEQNLRRLASHVDLPPRPTAAQRARWQTDAVQTANLAQPPKGIFMRRLGWFTMTGSAAAAIVLGAVVLLHPAGTPVVQARAILNELKNAVHRGLRIECKDLAADGAEVQAKVSILFKEGVNLAQLMESRTEGVPEPEAVYLDARVALDESHDEVAGLRLTTQGAFSETDSWLFVRFDTMPEKLLEEAPPLVLFQNMSRNGVLLDLKDLGEEGSLLAKMVHDHDDDNADQDAGDGENGDSGSGVKVVVSADDHSLNIGAGGEIGAGDDAQSKALEELALSVASGRAGRDQLQELVAALEQQAERAEVKEVEPGFYILRAERFALDDEFLKDATLEVGYREGAGPEWMKIENIGERHGSIRIEFVDDIPAEDRPSREPYLTNGTQVIDVAKLAESFASMANGWGDANENGGADGGNENSNGD